jgi:ribosomal protein S18 acetylase RimI-like enzyme
MEQPVVRDGTVADLAAIGAIEADVSWPVEDYLAYQLDVAEIEGEVVGFLVTRRLVEGEAEILNLAVGSGFRRRGVARVLLEKAFERWPGRWFLEVRASNGGAQLFYKNMGFQKIGVRPGYYPTENGKSPEEGIVMEMRK